jgi:HPr kinase/phosphorylase
LKQARELVHGTCVAFGRQAALLRGRPGAGKSDLALRFMALPPDGDGEPRLVADDQVWVDAKANGSLYAAAPATIAGKIEVRGIGIMEVPFLAEARLVLVCDLVSEDAVPRMPPNEAAIIAGVPVPALKLAPFLASAPLKLKMALLRGAPGSAN